MRALGEADALRAKKRDLENAAVAGVEEGQQFIVRSAARSSTTVCAQREHSSG